MAADPAYLPLSPGERVYSMLGAIDSRVAKLERTAGTIGEHSIDGGTHIAVGSITAASGVIGSLSADVITTGTLAAAVITVGSGGRLQTATTDPRVIFDSAGIRSTSATGVTLVDLNAAGTFEIKTASSGARVKLDTAGLVAYNSSSVETVRIDSASGKLKLGTSGARIEADSQAGIFAYNSSSQTVFAVSIPDALVYIGGTTGARIEAGRSYFRAIDGSGVEKLRFDIASGNLSITGALTAGSGSAVPITYVTTGNVVSGTVITLPSGGGYFQTSPSNPRIQFDNAGMRGYDSGGVNTWSLDATDGSFTALKGTITGMLLRTAAATGARVQMVGSVASGGGTNALEVYDSTPTKVVSLDGTDGLKLAIGTFADGERLRSVSWVDGSVITGRIKQYRSGTSPNIATYLQLRSGLTTGGETALVEISAVGSTETPGVPYASMLIAGSSTAGAVDVTAKAGAGSTKQATILDGADQSSFIRGAASAITKTLLAAARIDGRAGFVGVTHQTGGISVARTAAGTYTVTFPTAALSNWMIAGSTQGIGGATFVQSTIGSTTTATVTVVNAAGTPTDDIFEIIAVGV